MAKFILDGIAVRGVSCAVPTKKYDNTDYYDRFGKEYVDDFIATTGVRSTYRASENQTASDLCFVAADNLIKEKGIDRDKIGAIVFITQTPDYRYPATACVLHHRLGLPLSCMAFDVNLGCSGYVYGLNIVGSLMKTSDIESAILMFGDTSTKTNSPDDKSSFMLFGDSGSATYLVKEEGATVKGELMTDGDGFNAIMMPAGGYRMMHGSHERVLWPDGNMRSDYDGYMNGTDVFSFSISKVPKLINKFISEEGYSPEELDALVLHQANMLILKQISRKTKIPMEKIPVSMDRYGNTSGTSIPLTLCDKYGEETEGEFKGIISGFGIGLSWGVVGFDISKKDILPIAHTDDYFKNGGVKIG